MDSVLLTNSSRVLYGLRDMMTAAIGEHDYIYGHVDVPIALLVIEAAKRAEDRDEWFPHGKWATIQSMQAATDRQMATMFRATEPDLDENAEFATYAGEIANDAAKYAKTVFDFAQYAEKNAADAEYPTKAVAKTVANYAKMAADSAERAARFAQYASNSAAKSEERLPTVYPRKDNWVEFGTVVLAAKTPAEQAAENALCNAAYLAKKTE